MADGSHPAVLSARFSVALLTFSGGLISIVAGAGCGGSPADSSLTADKFVSARVVDDLQIHHPDIYGNSDPVAGIKPGHPLVDALCGNAQSADKSRYTCHVTINQAGPDGGYHQTWTAQADTNGEVALAQLKHSDLPSPPPSAAQDRQQTRRIRAYARQSASDDKKGPPFQRCLLKAMKTNDSVLFAHCKRIAPSG